MKKVILPLTIAALLFLSACNLARGGTPEEEVISGDTAAEQQTAVALAVQQTQIALTMQAPQPVIPTETPSITLSPTASVPMVTVSVETNCRTGPGAPFDIIAVLPIGSPAEVIGRNSSGNTWIIRLPSNPGVTCWLWGQYATVTGNTTGLPIYADPPTPTPPVGFSLAYVSTSTCSGFWGFRIKIINTGPVIWRSYEVSLTDSTTATTTYYFDDIWYDYTGCGAAVASLQDLEPGEEGIGGNWATGLLVVNPAGHSISMTFTLYELDGLAGQHTSKTFTFIP